MPSKGCIRIRDITAHNRSCINFRLKMKMILNLEIKGMTMRMGMKRSKTRVLLCVTMKTRLHCYWGKIYYWCTKENICLWEADGEMTTVGLVTQVLENPLY